MLFRLLFWGLIIYFIYKIVNNILNAFDNKIQVKGTRKKKSSLNLDNQDVEDADFEEIED